MPAAAVIPAPVAYIKVVAVKKLVVGFQIVLSYLSDYRRSWAKGILSQSLLLAMYRGITLRKLKRFKQVFAVNMLAWNNTL